MSTITTCLWFDGNASEAVDRYVSIFPDSSIGDTTHFGPAMPYPDGTVWTIAFTLLGRPFMALNAGPDCPFTPAISQQISAATQEEVDHFANELGTDGEIGPCGWVTDRFGLSWQVVPDDLVTLICDPNPGRALAVGRAMLTMTVIDIAGLHAAADAIAPAGTAA